MKVLARLLIAVPVAVLLDVLRAAPEWVFVASVAAIIPLAGWVSLATEDLSRRVGAVGGSLLNATLSNVAELVIALFALRAGLAELVKASIAGTIVANILLVLGASAFIGGWFHKVQHFHRQLARGHASMLLLAVTALLVPTLFHHTRPGLEDSEAGIVSLAVAGVLIVTYGLYLLFTLGTHPIAPSRRRGGERPRWSVASAVAILVAAVAAIVWLSDILVRQVEEVVAGRGLSQLFLGFIIIPLAGNAAEYGVAVSMAMKNRMNLAVGVALVSSIQGALLLAPLLVMVSRLFPEPLTLVFTLLEVTALTLAVLIANMVAVDGESNWFEGAQLLAAYLILLFAFYFV